MRGKKTPSRADTLMGSVGSRHAAPSLAGSMHTAPSRAGDSMKSKLDGGSSDDGSRLSDDDLVRAARQRNVQYIVGGQCKDCGGS